MCLIILEKYMLLINQNSLTCDKQVILLMISNGENWHYPTVKSLPGLLRGITSSHKESFDESFLLFKLFSLIQNKK